MLFASVLFYFALYFFFFNSLCSCIVAKMYVRVMMRKVYDVKMK